MSISALLPLTAAAQVGVEAVKNLGSNFAKLLASPEASPGTSSQGTADAISLTPAAAALRHETLRKDILKKFEQLAPELRELLRQANVQLDPSLKLQIGNAGFTSFGHPDAIQIERALGSNRELTDALAELFELYSKLQPGSDSSNVELTLGESDLEVRNVV